MVCAEDTRGGPGNKERVLFRQETEFVVIVVQHWDACQSPAFYNLPSSRRIYWTSLCYGRYHEASHRLQR